MGRNLLASQSIDGGRDLIKMQSQEVSAPKPQKKPLTFGTAYDDLTDGVKANAIQEVNWLEMWDEASPEQLAVRKQMKLDTQDMESGLIGGNIEMLGQMSSLLAGAGQKALVTGGVGATYGLATGGPAGALTAGTATAAASFPVWMAWDAYKLNTGEAWEALTEYGKKENLSLTKEQTRDMAGFVGMGMATLDFIGLSAVAKPFTRIGKRLLVRSAAQAMSNPSVIKGVLLGGKDAFVSWFTETITEGLQEGVKELGKDAMSAWDSVDMAEVAAGAGQAIATGAGGGSQPVDLPAELDVLLPSKERLGEIFDIMVEESKNAGKNMILTGGLSGVASTAGRVTDAKHKKIVQQAELNLKEKGATPQEIATIKNGISVEELQAFNRQQEPRLLTTVERIQPKLDAVENMEELVGEREALIAGLEKDKTIDKATRYEMIDGLRKAETAEEMQIVVDGMREQLKTGQKRTELRKVIKEKKFQKVENLRKAMELPTVKKMNKKEIGSFIETLSKYEENDVFLTQRQIETVDKTELSGMRTLREARSALSDKLNVPVEDLQNIKVSSLDRLRYDTALARKNPFYKMLVEDYYAETLESEASYLQREETINDLTKKARKSRKRTIGERFIPTDKRVFKYLESDQKEQVAKDMTKEELALAKHLQEEFAGALEHLIKIKALETGRENYITNVRRDFLEAWKEGGIKSAIKEIFNQQKLDEQTFDILDQKTGDILPLEKFFQFAMKRSGGLEPSQNVAKAAATYFKAFEKKRALDQFMPKMMVFVDAVSSDKKTSTGLEADQQLKNFVKEWINTKKGRPTKLLLKPGGKLDIVTKTLKMFITLLDLGFNIPVGAAATVGETVANYVNMGKKKTVIGAARFATKKGRAIVKNHKNYIGKSVWSQLFEPSVGVLDKGTTAMLAFFTESARNANKMFLLGSLTKEEFESGNISKERLAELKLEMGRWRTYAGAKSILGSTTEVGLFTQYKSWAIPILSSTASNIQKLVKSTYSKEARSELKMRDVRELGAAIEVTAAALTAISMMGDDDDDTFQGQLTAKVKREALTILGALDPTFYASEPRMIQFASQVAEIAKDLVTLEEYSQNAQRDIRGKNKAIEKTKRIITPRAVKQFIK